MLQTETQVVLGVTREGGKFRLRSPLRGDLQEFFGTLPAARWDRGLLCWTCDATPATAWRILQGAPESSRVEAADEVREMYLAFAAERHAAMRAATDDACLSHQPEFRRSDAWAHQLRAYHFADAGDAAMLNCAMGTGKSRVAVDLIVNRGCKRTLILCPVAVRGVWRREFNKWAGRPVEVLVLESGTTAKKLRDAQQFMQICEARSLPAVVVVNYETAWREPLAKWLLAQSWDAAILDESQRIKSPSGKSSKFCEKLAKRAARRLCLSGTPMPHSPLDLFSQYRFLDPGLFGTSYTRFRNEYAVTGPFGADHVVGFKNQEQLAARAGLLMYEVGSEVLDLPESLDEELTCDLSKDARQVYESLAEELIAEVNAGVVTAANGMVKLLRLQQITSGYLPVEDPETGAEQVAFLGREKQELLADLLSDLPVTEPVVVFCRFREDLNRVREVAEILGRRYGELSGRQRDLTQDATMPEGIDLMGVQIQSGGVGIDLTRACYAVYYSLGYSLGDYLQSRARVLRPGQTRPVRYLHLITRGTVDELVYRALEKRQEVVEHVLELIRKNPEFFYSRS